MRCTVLCLHFKATILFRKARDGGPKRELHAVRGEMRVNRRNHLRIHRRHDLREHFHHGHFEAEVLEILRHL